jgi:hypothetical protein
VCKEKRRKLGLLPRERLVAVALLYILQSTNERLLLETIPRLAAYAKSEKKN